MQNKIIKYTKKTLLWTLTPVLILVIVVALFINLHPTFGDGPNAESLTKISQSKHYHDGHFRNLVKTDLMTESDEESYSIMNVFFHLKIKTLVNHYLLKNWKTLILRTVHIHG